MRRVAFLLLCLIIIVIVFLEITLMGVNEGWTVYPPTSSMTDEQLNEISQSHNLIQTKKKILVLSRISFCLIVGLLLSPWLKEK